MDPHARLFHWRSEPGRDETQPKDNSNQNLCYLWSKDFLEAANKRLAGDTAREATSDEVKGLRTQSLNEVMLIIDIPKLNSEIGQVRLDSTR